jgi:hypothetical protein
MDGIAHLHERDDPDRDGHACKRWLADDRQPERFDDRPP